MGRTILKAVFTFLFTVTGWLIMWAARWLFRGLRWGVVGHPRTALGLGLLGGAVHLIGWEIVLGILGLVLVGTSIWHQAHRASFEAWVGEFVRTWWSRWWTYNRVWTKVMTRCGLAVEESDTLHVPRITSVATTPYWDTLTVAMQVGQEPEDFVQAGGRLRSAFRAHRVEMDEVKPASMRISLMRRDPFLHERVPAAPIPASLAEVDFSALRIGTDEHLRPVTVSVVGGHVAIAGATGSGKAGLEWNILRGLAPAIAAGLVKPVFIDPKARELRQGLPLLADPADYAVTAAATRDLLARLVEEMEQANETAAGDGERDFEPTLATPLRPIFIDELAPLLAYWARSVRDKIEDLMGLLLTQGRVTGHVFVGAIQEPTKDIFKNRDLFGRRMALRLPTESHTDAILTDKASERGAHCHRIPENLPGVGFVLPSGATMATRFRLGHVQNQDIQELVDTVDRLRTADRVVPIRPQLTAGEVAA